MKHYQLLEKDWERLLAVETEHKLFKEARIKLSSSFERLTAVNALKLIIGG